MQTFCFATGQSEFDLSGSAQKETLNPHDFFLPLYVSWARTSKAIVPCLSFVPVFMASLLAFAITHCTDWHFSADHTGLIEYCTTLLLHVVNTSLHHISHHLTSFVYGLNVLILSSKVLKN